MEKLRRAFTEAFHRILGIWGIVVSADHSQCAEEADADLACWAVVVAALNTIAAHATWLGQTIIRQVVRLGERMMDHGWNAGFQG